MSTLAIISPEEYLATSYPDLDREYVRGQIVERTMPAWSHAELQVLLGGYFLPLRQSHRLFAASELRLRLAPDLIRIPDLCVFAEQKPDKAIPDTPPLVVIEILSPDDRMGAVLEKLAEYEAFGVPHIWLANPMQRTFAIYRNGSLVAVSVFELSGYPLKIIAADLFEQ